jgi:hypothetical protein
MHLLAALNTIKDEYPKDDEHEPNSHRMAANVAPNKNEEHTMYLKDHCLSWTLALNDVVPFPKSLHDCPIEHLKQYGRFCKMREQSINLKGYGRRRRWESTCIGHRICNREGKRSFINIPDCRFVKWHRQ